MSLIGYTFLLQLLIWPILDVAILREGLKFARQLGNTAPLSNHLGSELTPGSSVSTDDEWDAWLVTQAGTEYHPGGTSAMLPKSQGGVVNAKLQVYGLGMFSRTEF